MSKKALPLILTLALVAALLLYLKSKGQSSQEPTLEAQSAIKTVSEGMELARAIETGRPTSCKLTKDKELMSYYVEGGKSRVDIAKGDTTSHMLNDGSYFYIWTDGQSAGAIKMPIPATASDSSAKAEAQKYESQAPSLKSKADYDALKGQGYTINCQAVASDASKLTPPSDIKFVDPSSLMQAVPSGAAMSKEQIEELQKQYENLGQ